MNAYVEYQGWSGCILEVPGDGALPTVVFDPAPGAPPIDPSPGKGPPLILITHGHPEHVQGAAHHLGRSDRRPVVVAGSSSVCHYLGRRSVHPEDRFIPVTAGERFEEQGWRIDVFGWQHMGLLPPGLSPKLRHLGRLLSNPAQLLGIVADGLWGPAHGPMLGYRLESIPAHTKPLVYFGEGLHRRSTAQQLLHGLGDEATLVAGVEPEDVDALPGLLEGKRIYQVLSFEPHHVWRERFGMRRVDWPDFQDRLAAVGISCRPLTAGDRVQLDWESVCTG